MSKKPRSPTLSPVGTTHSEHLLSLQARLERISVVLSQITAQIESCITQDAYWICPKPASKPSPRSPKGLSKSRSRKSGHESGTA